GRRTLSFPVDAPPAAYSLPFTVTDQQNRTAMGNIIFSIVSPVGGMAPTTAVIGSITKATVRTSNNNVATPNVTSVTLDASPISLANNIALNDAGTNGDVTANNGTYSCDIRVPLTAALG